MKNRHPDLSAGQHDFGMLHSGAIAVANLPSGGESAFSPREFWKKTTRFLLNHIFEEAARNNKIPTPDEAIQRMHELMARLVGPPAGHSEAGNLPKELRRLDLGRMEREAHHYAVDLYHDALRPRKGAPRLRPEYLDQLLRWHTAGLNPRKIAIKLGYGSSAEAKDLVTKQLRIAKLRRGKK